MKKRYDFSPNIPLTVVTIGLKEIEIVCSCSNTRIVNMHNEIRKYASVLCTYEETA